MASPEHTQLIFHHSRCVLASRQENYTKVTCLMTLTS